MRKLLAILSFVTAQSFVFIKAKKEATPVGNSYPLQIDPNEITKATIDHIGKKFFANTYYVKLSGGTGTGLDSNAQAWSYAKFNSAPIPAGSTVLFRSGEKFYGTMQAWAGTS